MKLCSFYARSPAGRLQRVGIALDDGRLLDAHNAYATMLAERDGHPCAWALAAVLAPTDMAALVAAGHFGLQALRECRDYVQAAPPRDPDSGLDGSRLLHQPQTVQLAAPLPRPRSLRDCVGFLDHIRNAMAPAPMPAVYEAIPAIYYKGNVNSVSGPEQPIVVPSFGEHIDYELEVAAVIGRRGVDIPVDKALDHVFGYTIFNDVSARTQQYLEMEGMLGPTKGKDFDGGNAMGPVLVSADAFDPRTSHAMVARVNGQEWSRGDILQMDRGFAEMISYISRHETLYPGDVIGSGTVPTGCGAELRRFPRVGDVIELEVEGIGVLRNRLAAR
jgi:2-keto-4-pentenoate hydratase/2-oxohepta-3-ene-1,7-dioic acid hydratase in catechol pathway